MLVNPAAFEFAATVMQEDVGCRVRAESSARRCEARRRCGDRTAGARLARDSGRPVRKRFPLPPPAGVRVEKCTVAQEDNQPNKAAEPFFAVIGKLDSDGKFHCWTGVWGKSGSNFLPSR